MKSNDAEQPLHPVGKLNRDLLERLLSSQKSNDSSVLIGPRVGEDAAVIEFGDKLLVAKTDPITFATDHIGWYAVNINANDLATMGATPRWFLASVLLPEQSTIDKLVQDIFEDIVSACDALEITLCGGHTEITYDLDRPIVVGQMLGEVARDKLVDKRNARPGDHIILTKGIAIEATSVIAREKEDELLLGYNEDFLTEAKAFLGNPGLSVVKEALIANDTCRVHAMHDPTEGGLATGLEELAIAANAGLLIHKESINVYDLSRTILDEYELDPMGAIASGALLIVVASDDSERVLAALREEKIECAIIGEMKEKAEGCMMDIEGKITPLPKFDRDEIAKLF